MTNILAKAFEKAAKLSQNLQDEIGEQLLGDIEGEIKWNETLDKSHDKLGKLAEKASEDFKSGRTKKMGFDEL